MDVYSNLFELLQGAQVGWVWSPRVDLRPRRPGNFTDIDVATRVDCETMRRKELSKFGPCRRVAEAADQIAPVVYDTDARPEIGNITADGGGRADFADLADRLMTVWHVEAARTVQVLPLRLVFAVAVENLDAMVLTVRDIEPAVGVAADVVDDVELALAGSGFAPRPLPSTASRKVRRLESASGAMLVQPWRSGSRLPPSARHPHHRPLNVAGDRQFESISVQGCKSASNQDPTKFCSKWVTRARQYLAPKESS